MPIWLLQFWKSVTKTLKAAPAWLWGLLTGLVMMLAMYLRMRAAVNHANSSEADTVRAKLKAKAAKNDATIAVELEKIDTLAKKRTHIREATATEIAAIHDMDDEQLSSWLQADARRRRLEKRRDK